MTLITLTDPRSPASEAYRTLRTNLSFYSVDNPIRGLVVTSPSPDEGKSTTAANLAVTLAQSGRRTLLVDCDLRRPSIHTLFEVSAEPGLTNLLTGQTDEIPVRQTEVDNLFLLTSGAKPPNPADMLISQKLDAVVERLTAEFDIVIFDAPPVIAVTDAAVLGAKVDGVLLVLKAGKTKRDHAERAKELLEKAHVRIVGATLTNAPKDDAVGGYYSD